MVLEHYISDLLYRYNCIVVPGFGAFLTNKQGAKLIADSNTFHPPTKEISFNAQLTSNDGLLVSYIAEVEKTNYEEVLSKMDALTNNWKETLEKKGRLDLKKIGVLFLSSEGNLLFQPQSQINYLNSSFGLSSFYSSQITREVLKEEVVALEEKIPFIITPEKRETSSFRPYLKYAAVLLLALSTGLTGYRFYKKGMSEQQVVRQDAQKEVTKQIQEATFFNTAPLELPTVNVMAVTTVAKTTARHHIVAVAFRIKANADRKIKALQQKGYNAAYYGTNTYGLHVVTYDRHNNTQEALKALKEIKRTQSSDAWLLSEK